MKITDIFEEVFTALTANKVRTALTMLGIVIGIGSVIAMLSIGQGVQNSITSQVEANGANLIIVMPGVQRSTGGGGVSMGRGSAQSLTLDDAIAIKDIANVAGVEPEVSSNQQIVAGKNNTRSSIIGTTIDYPSVRNAEVEFGSFFTDLQNNQKSRVAVLGATIVTDLFNPDEEEGFDSSTVIGQKIKIASKDFTIIGILKEKGGTSSTQDSGILIPIKTAQQYFTGNSYVSTIYVAAASSDDSTQVNEDIATLLTTRHKIKEGASADFSTMNMTDLLDTVATMTTTFSIFLGSIAGISLLVGGIGIMNMMLTTVTERMREIGLRKAIGAKARDVSSQFLIEAVALTFIGGGLGIVLGWGLGVILDYVLPLISTDLTIETEISAYAIILAFSVSAVIGIVFGYYPARRASKMNPIEALRYE